jgi:hypothetical protein
MSLIAVGWPRGLILDLTLQDLIGTLEVADATNAVYNQVVEKLWATS